MKKRNRVSIVIVIVMTILFTACSSAVNTQEVSTQGQGKNPLAAQYDDYYAARVKYAGDNSAVMKLLDILGVSELGPYTLELATDKEPYGLKICYSEAKDAGLEGKLAATKQIDYAYYLLALVDNLSSVEVNYKTSRYYLDIAGADKEIHGDIKAYGQSSEKLKELNAILNPAD